jgi:hypothetical protein
MVCPSPTLAALLWIGAILWIDAPLTVGAAERTAPPRLCPADAPEGVRLPLRPGCDRDGPVRGAEETHGFRDVGGVKLRVGGRVGAEFSAGR